MLWIPLDRNLRSKCDSVASSHHFQPHYRPECSRDLLEQQMQIEIIHHLRKELTVAVNVSHFLQNFASHSLQPATH